jgi:hypothetical protein
VKCNCRHIVAVTIECYDGAGVGRFYIIKLDRVMSSRGKKSLIWGDAEPVYLRLWMRDSSRADPTECLPKSVGFWLETANKPPKITYGMERGYMQFGDA